MRLTFDLVAMGRAGVDLYSLDYGRSLEESKRFAKYVGGTAANTVVGASRLGLRCALVSRVSADELGSYVKGFLAQERVDVSHTATDPRRKTGIVFAEISPGRDGKFIFYRENAADLHITKRDVPDSLIAETKVLLVTGTGLSAEPSLGATLHAAHEARRLSKTVVFNLDWRPSLWRTSSRERVRRYAKMLEIANVVVGNRGEYLAATGQVDLRSALSAIPGARNKLLVVTSGEKGSEIRWQGRLEKAGGFRVKHVKGLGGGDGFLAGFLSGRHEGWGPREAAIFGNAVGAIVVTGHSCSESMPRRARVVKFLKANGYSFDPKSGPSKP